MENNLRDRLLLDVKVIEDFKWVICNPIGIIQGQDHGSPFLT